jgi:hypothetical protein
MKGGRLPWEWREVDIHEETPPIWRDLRGNRLDVCVRERGGWGGEGHLGSKRNKGWVGVAGGDAYLWPMVQKPWHKHAALPLHGWYVANVSIIFDAPCLFYTNCFMFYLHFMDFYAFYGTNLLTRCHSASSCFLQFFYSRFLLKEIFSELDETKAKVPIYLTRRWSPKERRRPARSRPHLVVARPSPWPCHPMVWAPWVPTDLALPPINSHLQENPRGPSLHPRKVP